MRRFEEWRDGAAHWLFIGLYVPACVFSPNGVRERAPATVFPPPATSGVQHAVVTPGDRDVVT